MGAPSASPGSIWSPTWARERRRKARSPEPTRLLTKPSAGWAMISAGDAHWSSRPPSMTAMRCPRWIASSMSWVTSTMVVPSRFWMARRSSCALVRMTGSRAPKGSSMSRTLGPAARARATPTRCCWPPESSCGRRSRNWAGSSWKRSSSSSTRVEMRALSQPRRRGTVAMLSATERCGKRPLPWMT